MSFLTYLSLFPSIIQCEWDWRSRKTWLIYKTGCVVSIRWQTEMVCYSYKTCTPLVYNRQLFPFIFLYVFLRFDRNENGTIFIRYTKHNKHSILHIVWIQRGVYYELILCALQNFACNRISVSCWKACSQIRIMLLMLDNEIKT